MQNNMFRLSHTCALLICINFLHAVAYFTSIDCVPIEFDGGSETFKDAYDFDREQSEARYDPRLLSEELRGTHSVSAEGGAEDCLSAAAKYEHGQKIPRNDPCEVCLCVDGEIFCWWKQCEFPSSKVGRQKVGVSTSGSDGQRHRVKNVGIPLAANVAGAPKSAPFIPTHILSFPQNLPVHLPDNLTGGVANDTGATANAKKSTQSAAVTQLPLLSTSVDSGRDRTVTVPPLPLSEHRHLPENILSSNTVMMGRRPPPPPPPPPPTGPVTTITTTSVAASTTTAATTTVAQSAQHNVTGNVIYEKTIVNRNGIFVEDVRKVSGGGGGGNGLADLDELKSEPQKIRIDDESLAKHYFITSSGSVEDTDTDTDTDIDTGTDSDTDTGTDTLASDNVVTQFRNGFGAYLTDQMTINTNDANARTPAPAPAPAPPPILSTTQAERTELSTATPSTGDVVAAARKDIVAATTTRSPNSHCIVMGKTYEVGTILPQETGNCLQCLCIKGSSRAGTPPDAALPRVTCSPHNCPPLILPDLFDSTGY